MKIKRLACAATALALLSLFPLSACGDGITGSELNILDDNYRNYYEIFVYSFCDSDGDGVGDLKGVTQKLDYVQEMGFNGIWLMPINPTDSYHGYDVKDYKAINPKYGTTDDFKELMEEAHARGINVIIDLVLNHSSVQHEWYQKAVTALRSGNPNSHSNAKYVNYYNFSQTSKQGYSSVSGVNGWYYECRFDTAMPDLNLDSEDVRDEITDIMEYWLTDMDVDGFRLDACTSFYTGNVDKNVEFLSFVNETAKGIKEDAYIVGEVWEGTDTQIRRYYDSGIDSCFLFTASQGGNGTITATFSSLQEEPGVYFTDLLLNYQKTYDTGILAPFLCNHDTTRIANACPTESRVKMAAGLMALMNGSTFVYYGDEIGMISASNAGDPGKRIPIRWEEKLSEGQVIIAPSSGVDISAKAYKYPSVAEQKEDSASILNYYKAAMRLRNCHPEIARGTIEKVTAPNPYVAAFKKTYDGKSIIILVNLNNTEEYKVDISAYGDVKVTDVLDVNPETTLSGKTLSMKPYSIAILK